MRCPNTRRSNTLQPGLRIVSLTPQSKLLFAASFCVKFVMRKGFYKMAKVPATIRFVLDGEMLPYLLVKDLILQKGKKRRRKYEVSREATSEVWSCYNCRGTHWRSSYYPERLHHWTGALMGSAVMQVQATAEA